MSKSNRSAKQALIRLYGRECFIDKLKLRPDTDKVHYTGKAQYHRMKQLTYHHIQEKRNGGKATVENGAILSVENHEWFNKQSPEKQKEMNAKFQEYKRTFNFRIAAVELTTQGIQQAQMIEFEDAPEIEVIPAFDMTEEDMRIYEEHKRKRNERVFEKFAKLKDTKERDDGR